MLYLPVLVAAAHALVRGLAGVGHGRGLHLDALQAAAAFLVVEFAADHAAFDALMSGFGMAHEDHSFLSKMRRTRQLLARGAAEAGTRDSRRGRAPRRLSAEKPRAQAMSLDWTYRLPASNHSMIRGD